jgi:carbon storage regulator
MLVLSRKKGESLRIGEDIVLTVMDVQGEQVRIGIDAPREVQVWRQELYEAVKESNALAAKTVRNPELMLKLEPLAALVPVAGTDTRENKDKNEDKG